MSTSGEQDLLLITVDPHALEAAAAWVRVTSPGDALRCVHAHRPRAVLVRIDSRRAAEAVREVLEALHRRWPKLALVVVSSSPDDQIERSVRAAGVHCYLHGEFDLRRVGDVLGAAAGPARPPPPRVNPTVPRPLEARAQGPPPAGRRQV